MEDAVEAGRETPRCPSPTTDGFLAFRPLAATTRPPLASESPSSLRLHSPSQVLVLSGKGGVGKSTVSAQLAFALASQVGGVGEGLHPTCALLSCALVSSSSPHSRSCLPFSPREQGLEVGLLDIDICGPSLPRMLGLEGHDVHQVTALGYIVANSPPSFLASETPLPPAPTRWFLNVSFFGPPPVRRRMVPRVRVRQPGRDERRLPLA